MNLVCTILIASLLFLQGIGGKAGVGGKGGFGGGASGAPSAPAILQSNFNTVDGATTITLPNHAAGGMSVVGLISDVTLTISNTAAFTWTTSCNTTAKVGRNVCLFTAPKSAFGSTDTVTLAGVPNHTMIFFADVSVVSSIDNLAATSSSGTTAPSSGNITLTGTNDIVFTVENNDSGGSSTPSGYTLLTVQSGGQPWGAPLFQQAAYQTLTTTPANATFSGAAFNWDMETVVLK